LLHVGANCIRPFDLTPAPSPARERACRPKGGVAEGRGEIKFVVGGRPRPPTSPPKNALDTVIYLCYRILALRGLVADFYDDILRAGAAEKYS